MAEQTNTTELVKPYNPTDPIVKFDPELDASKIVKYYQESDPAEAPINTTSDNQLKTDAVRFPLIKLNNKILDKSQIASFDLQIKGFLPQLKLEINDGSNNIQATDVPGMNNVITIILIAPVDGANKKISMDFYINKCDFHDGRIQYTGEYKLVTLKQTKCTQIGTGKLSTYQMLQEIAKESKLGFAATEGCENISDARWRQIYSQSYKDYIEKQLSFAGLDEDSIFDAWIDEFGYIVMANLPYIMKQNVNPKQLTIKVISGLLNDDTSAHLPDQSVDEIERMITNKEGEGINNLRISKYESIVNNDKIKNNGTLNTLWIMSNPGLENKIEQKQVQIIENSADGKAGSDEYEYSTEQFIGVEMSDTPILLQQTIVKNYKMKLDAKQLYVEMPSANYTLQRGMLVNVILEEYDPVNKRTILTNWENAYQEDAVDDDTAEELDADTQASMDDLTINDGPVPNPALSGLYYINQIGFMYHEGEAEITQYMYLYKKGLQTNIVNKYAATKIKKN